MVWCDPVGPLALCPVRFADEHLASAGHYAYDVIEVCVPNKKNFKFGLWASYKPTPSLRKISYKYSSMLTYIPVSFLFSFIFMVRVRVKNRVRVRVSFRVRVRDR